MYRGDSLFQFQTGLYWTLIRSPLPPPHLTPPAFSFFTGLCKWCGRLAVSRQPSLKAPDQGVGFVSTFSVFLRSQTSSCPLYVLWKQAVLSSQDGALNEGINEVHMACEQHTHTSASVLSFASDQNPVQSSQNSWGDLWTPWMEKCMRLMNFKLSWIQGQTHCHQDTGSCSAVCTWLFSSSISTQVPQVPGWYKLA
jgi:hypothetical protein